MNQRTDKNLHISILSPVHIGCDSDLDPTQFVIQDEVLHLLHPEAMLSAFTGQERQELLNTLQSSDANSLGNLFQLLKSRRDKLAQASVRVVDVARALVTTYENLGKNTQKGNSDNSNSKVINRMRIMRTAFDPFTLDAYLPGSSLKGSIRTAWLDFINNQRPVQVGEDRLNFAANRRLQQRLLGYTDSHLENDPLRHVQLADAHICDEETPLPTRILYAVSKSKRPGKESKSAPSVPMEVIHEALPNAFKGQLRLTGDNKINWDSLCQACNRFYVQQLKDELEHQVLGNMLNPMWRKTMQQLLVVLQPQIQANKGFLLRVGKHSGAESVTLNGVRAIAIRGARGSGKNRGSTSEKRFASAQRDSAKATHNLLPFGWLWVSLEADAVLSEALSPMSKAACEQYLNYKQQALIKEAKRQETLSEQQEQARVRAAEKLAQEQQEAERAERLAQLSDNQRLIQEWVYEFQSHHERYPQFKEKMGGAWHNKARQIIKLAHENPAWTGDEKRCLVEAVTAWLPKLVSVDMKVERRNLKFAALLGDV